MVVFPFFSSGLTGGEIAGIVIGAITAILGCLSLAYFCSENGRKCCTQNCNCCNSENQVGPETNQANLETVIKEPPSRIS